jgi:hypothetical protein
MLLSEQLNFFRLGGKLFNDVIRLLLQYNALRFICKLSNDVILLVPRWQ